MTAPAQLVEPVQMTEREAENITEQIVGRLDQVAENIEAVQSLMRDALQRRAHLALGYDSPTAYMRDRFEGTLVNLSAALRREIVHELSDAGLSTRAIAPIVGVSHMTVSSDLSSGVKPFTPAPDLEELQAQDEVEAMTARVEHAPRAVVGIDGKTYPASTPKVGAKPRRPISATALDLGLDLSKIAERVDRLRQDDRFGRSRDEVAKALRDYASHALTALNTLMEEIEGGDAK